MIRKRRTRQQGYTLIELLIVMIIIGILAAIAMPAYLSARESGKKAGQVRNPLSGGEAIVQSGQNVSGAAVVVADRTATRMARVNLTSQFPFTGSNPQQLNGAVVVTICSDGYLVYSLFNGAAFDKRLLPYAAMQDG